MMLTYFIFMSEMMAESRERERVERGSSESRVQRAESRE